MNCILNKMSLFHWFFFKHFASKNQLPGLFKWKIGWKWVYVCLEIHFTKNVDGLKTSQLFCIANYLTGFWLITVLTERYFWTEYSKFAMFQKVIQALISSDMNVILWFSFFFWSVTSGMPCAEHSLFIYCSQTFNFEWIA